VESAVGSLEFLDRRLVTDVSRTRWQRRVAELLRGYAPVTWQTPKGESEEDRLARASILGTLGEVGGNAQVIAGARTLSERYLRDPAAVDPTLAGTALNIAARWGDQALYDRFRSHYGQEKIPFVKGRYLQAMTRFRDPKVVAQAIDFAFSGAVRTQDLPGYLAGLLSNPAARGQAWTAVQTHWADLTHEIPTAIGAITGSLSSFCDADAKKDIESFFATHPAGAGTRSLRRSMEAIDTCVAFRGGQQASFEKAIR
jgi:aminopeptidase N/puromycin-sensitive aminopeptidase